MNSKKWYLSKVLWVNVVTIIITLTTTLITQNILSAEIGATVIAVANIILRLLTNQPITGSPGDK